MIISLVAFAIIFVVIAALFVMVYVNNCVDKIVGQNEAVSVPSVAASVSKRSGAKDMKKIVAAISVAVCASTGRYVNIISVAPIQGVSCPNMTPVWRTKGIAECIESRLGSRSW